MREQAPAATRPDRTRPALRLLVPAAVLAVLGTVGFAAGIGPRAGWSFLAGLGIATAIATAGALLTAAAARLLPALSLMVALANYALTVLVFVLLLAVVDPSVAYVPAFAVGLASSVVPYLAWQFALARPPR